MQPYDLHIPSHIVFGKDRLDMLPEVISRFGKKVLLTYGGGSIKRMGLYDKVKNLLKDCTIYELSGIEPNPKIASVRAGVKICKEQKIDVVLAVGGGSVLDASKNICAGAVYDGDPWDLVLDASKVKAGTPMVSILTLSATGSEFNGSGVISNPDTNEKLPIFGNGILDAKVSFCDPQYTYTVPPIQTAAGAADILSHTFEQYFVIQGNILTDAFCEGAIKSVMHHTPIVLKDPNNYESRAELMMTSTMACCGLFGFARDISPWVCHAIEHEISAYTDITHGVGLAILTIPWMKYSLNEKTAPRFKQYGVNVFGLNPNDDAMTVANQAIQKTADFFKSIGLPAKLSDIGVTSEHFEAMADHVQSHWFADLKLAIRPVDKKGILEILNASL